MSISVAWETAEIRGPRVAHTLTPENCGRILKIAKNPLIVVGGGALDMKADDGVDVPDIVSKIAGGIDATVVVSPGVFKAFQRYSGNKLLNMGLEDVVNRIGDKSWDGFDGEGAYDLVIFIGGLYYFQSMMLSTLKHFAPKLKTISIDRFYHPNAVFSLANLTSEKWKEGLNAMTKILGVE